ncbi:hypothetical protein E5288_WYG007430 [Bos mutus]|uniref:KRAB domain-containing protein n=1 Tax=Bos mutus TaxID=72004 RepID=A0A6B0S572_9CETA|nr:hypothetical protein [Bos mutus]
MRALLCSSRVTLGLAWPSGESGELGFRGEARCPVPRPELIYRLEHGQELWTVKRDLSRSTCAGDKGKPKTRESTTSEPSLFEGASVQEQLTQRVSEDSQLGQINNQEEPLERHEGCLRPEIEPQNGKLPGNPSCERGSLGTAGGVCSRIVEEQVPLGGAVHDRDSCGSDALCDSSVHCLSSPIMSLSHQ